ncbi:MAG: hypothetical protein FWD51_07510, partial [Betaproteobacteria bacterium]|nr:hypothetical protein [Betaproteobacteria bacterium]
ENVRGFFFGHECEQFFKNHEVFSGCPGVKIRRAANWLSCPGSCIGFLRQQLRNTGRILRLQTIGSPELLPVGCAAGGSVLQPEESSTD